VPIWIAACRGAELCACVPVPTYTRARRNVHAATSHPMLHAPCAHIPHPTSHIPHAKRTPNDTLVAAADGIVDSRPSSVVAFLRDASPWQICSPAAVSISTCTQHAQHTQHLAWTHVLASACPCRWAEQTNPEAWVLSAGPWQ
jgi:hypothetical protein